LNIYTFISTRQQARRLQKFNHHADFQRRREACSRKKLNIYTFISTRQQARRLQKFNHHADF
ncbi:hypothetical protein, partial [Pseudoalteromonas carrageenovora]|uniref:hypothetical protein n=1 Tax=Pseudoalteromonas carrageenovora TaxID=227 RepID=UPI0026E20430